MTRHSTSRLSPFWLSPLMIASIALALAACDKSATSSPFKWGSQTTGEPNKYEASHPLGDQYLPGGGGGPSGPTGGGNALEKALEVVCKRASDCSEGQISASACLDQIKAAIGQVQVTITDLAAFTTCIQQVSCVELISGTGDTLSECAKGSVIVPDSGPDRSPDLGVDAAPAFPLDAGFNEVDLSGS